MTFISQRVDAQNESNISIQSLLKFFISMFLGSASYPYDCIRI